MNIAAVLETQARQLTDQPCVHYRGETWSYQALNEKVCALSALFIARGIKPGDIVAHTFGCERSLLVAMLATARLGATVFSVPANTPSARRRELLTSVGARWLATDIPDLAYEGLLTLLVDGDKTGDAYSSPINSQPVAPWVIATGSGSTGKPKFMPVGHCQQWARMMAGADWLPYDGSDVFASAVHLDFYAAKQRYLEAFARGSSIALAGEGRINFSDDSRKDRVTALYATVFHVEGLLRSRSGSVGPIPGLRSLMVGGSSVSHALRETVRDRICPGLYVLYGANECHTTCIAAPPEVYKTPETVGRPFKGAELEVVNNKDERLPPGQTGHIRIRGDAVIEGYLDDSAASVRAFRQGWFYPGDLGEMTEDGQLIHKGRADDLMIMNGINIYPAEIEQVMLGHPGVKDAVALPFSHPVHQNIPVCAVVLTGDEKPDEHALLAFARERLGAHSPHRIFVLPAIPRNDQGKLNREQLLAAMLPAQTESRAESSVNGERLVVPALPDGQLCYPMRFACQVPGGIDPAKLDYWLDDILGNDLTLTCPDFPDCTQVPEVCRQWLWRGLLLARLLMQAAGVPIFDPPRILDCQKRNADENNWIVVAAFAQMDEYPAELYSAALGCAFKLAVWAARAGQDDSSLASFFDAIEQQYINPLKPKLPPGKSTFPVLRAAHAMGIPFRHGGMGVFRLGWGHKGRWLDRSTTEQDAMLGARLTQNKMATARLLAAAGLPGPVHYLVNSKEAAVQAASRLGWPVVVKPVDGDRGEGVTVDIVEPAHLERIVSKSLGTKQHTQVLVERQVPGVCHRLFVAGGRLLYAVKRLPIGVYADGRQSVAALVAQEVARQQSRPPWSRSGIRPLDPLATQTLAAQGLALNTVPPKGVFIALRPIESTEWGGVDEDVSQLVHPENLKAALSAASLLSLRVAGVDIISRDIAVPWYDNDAVINEVNYSPLLGGGAISRSQVPRFVADYIDGDGRIPVHVFVGGPAALDRATRYWHSLVTGGVEAFLATADKSLEPGGDSVVMARSGLYHQCRALMLSSRVQALVLVIQDDEFLSTGLPLESVTSVTTVDNSLRLSRGEGVLNAARLHALQDLLAAWAR